jgi:hypothetical protein
MYRLLEKGEVILDGDEYYSHNFRWLKWDLSDGIKTLWSENYAPVRRAQNTKDLAATVTEVAATNSHYVPCFVCNQLMCKAKTYFGSPECTVARNAVCSLASFENYRSLGEN